MTTIIFIALAISAIIRFVRSITPNRHFSIMTAIWSAGEVIALILLFDWLVK